MFEEAELELLAKSQDMTVPDFKAKMALNYPAETPPIVPPIAPIVPLDNTKNKSSNVDELMNKLTGDAYTDIETIASLKKQGITDNIIKSYIDTVSSSKKEVVATTAKDLDINVEEVLNWVSTNAPQEVAQLQETLASGNKAEVFYALSTAMNKIKSEDVNYSKTLTGNSGKAIIKTDVYKNRKELDADMTSDLYKSSADERMRVLLKNKASKLR